MHTIYQLLQVCTHKNTKSLAHLCHAHRVIETRRIFNKRKKFSIFVYLLCFSDKAFYYEHSEMKQT
jgi:hypothetical protein